MDFFNPTPWLVASVQLDDNGNPVLDSEWTAAGLVRHYLYNPLSPEFSPIQQFWWAIIIGWVMGIGTACWKVVIRVGVDLVWNRIPNALFQLGVLDGVPMHHYMWLCCMGMGGGLSTFSSSIPGLNDWIRNLHARGVQDYHSLGRLLVLSTCAMISGLSLGPDVPLILVGGMAGSWLGVKCHQSVLQSRVLNLTAASAAFGGYFGFPMAGALFVLEVPHRTGLQYFEALYPAILSSTIASLTHQWFLGETTMTSFGDREEALQAMSGQMLLLTLLYGSFGVVLGMAYVYVVTGVKGLVFRGCFNDAESSDDDYDEQNDETDENGSLDYRHSGSPERIPLVEDKVPSKKLPERDWALVKRFVPFQPYRRLLVGALTGGLCGVIAMFVPHTLFSGKEQSFAMMERGSSPWPIFEPGKTLADGLTGLSVCIVDSEEEEGFGTQCALLLMVAKTAAIALSLGSGIVGGHFWGPVFVGSAASHALFDLLKLAGMKELITPHSGLALACVVGAAHVVTFRAHMTIGLILILWTPTTSTYGLISPSIFPFVVVAILFSVMASRKSLVYYKQQRSRGDIRAVAEVLCKPDLDGKPTASSYGHLSTSDGDDIESFSRSNGRVYPQDHSQDDINESSRLFGTNNVTSDLTQRDIEEAFMSKTQGLYGSVEQSAKSEECLPVVTPPPSIVRSNHDSNDKVSLQYSRLDELLSATTDDKNRRRRHYTVKDASSSFHLGSDDPFSSMTNTLTTSSGRKVSHRRSNSAPALDPQCTGASPKTPQLDFPFRPRKVSNDQKRGASWISQVQSFGELQQHQPPLLEQARLRTASADPTFLFGRRRPREIQEQGDQQLKRNGPRTTRNTRNYSDDMQTGVTHKSHSRQPSLTADDLNLAVSSEEMEQSFQSAFGSSILSEQP